MKKKIICLLISVLLLSVSFLGCSKNGQQGNSNTPGSPESEEVNLRFMYWGSPDEKAAVDMSIAAFEDNYSNIKVERMHVPADYVTRLTTMIAADDAPDASYVGAGQAVEWAKEGKFHDLTKFIQSDTNFNKEEYFEAAFQYWAPDKIWGVTPALETFAIFYNKDMFIEAGIDLPTADASLAWTWDEMVEVAKQLTVDQNGFNALDANFDPTQIVQFGLRVDSWWPWWLMVMLNDADFVSEDGTKFGLTEPNATEALQLLADLIHKHHVSPSPAQSGSLPGNTQTLQTQTVAMVLSGHWSLMDLSNAELNYGIAALPVLKAGPKNMIVGSGIGLYNTSQNIHPEETWLLAKYLIDPSYSVDLYRDGLWMPVIKKWYTDSSLIEKWAGPNNPARPPEFMDAFIKNTLEYAVPGPEFYVDKYEEFFGIVGPAIDPILNGTKTAQEAMDEIAPNIEELLGK